MNNAIEVKNLRKNYKDFSLKDISFSSPTGYIMGFVGQNGAGKTTTIRLMLNMTDRAGGEISLLGMDNLRDEQRIKQDVGVVLDEIYFVNNWSVREVEQALKPFYDHWNRALYSQYTQQFRLPLDKKVKDLSRGMRMKLMLAVAMSHDAKLLILDEPTSGLDPVARDELLQILRDYIDEEKSILFSTHNTTDLERIADYITSAGFLYVCLYISIQLPLYFRFPFSKVYIFSNLPVYLVAVFLVYLFKRTDFLHQLKQAI